MKNTEEYNFKFVLELCKIETKEEFEKICNNESIRNIFIYINLKKINLFNIKILKEFEQMCNSENFINSLENIELENLKNYIEAYNINTQEDFEQFLYNSEIWEDFYKKISWEKILDLSKTVMKYKENSSSPNYSWKYDEIIWPFSLIDLNLTKSDIVKWVKIWEQKKWWKMNFLNQRFFSVNEKIEWESKIIVNKESQLLVNRIFSPFLSMTRLIRLKNWKTTVASIDVNHKEAEWILKHKEWVKNEILDFLRIIYQYITLDVDRNRWPKHNLENGIIFDFDYMFYCNDFIENGDEVDFWLIKLTKEEKEDYSNILFFFKTYIVKYCIEEKEKITEDNQMYKYFEIMKNRAMQLSLWNILLYFKIYNCKLTK